MASLALSGCSVRSQAITGFRRPNDLTNPGLSPTSLRFRLSSLIPPRKSNLHERENIIGVTAQLCSAPRLPISSTSRSLSKPLKKTHLHPPYEFLKSYALSRTRTSRFLTLASNNDNNSNSNNNRLRKDPKEGEVIDEKSGGLGSNDRDDLSKENGWSIFNSIRWGELLNPDPDNILAIGLTGLLTWASVQVLWQLLFISLAIIVAAVKIKDVLRLRMRKRVFVAYSASNSNLSGGDAIEEKSDANTKNDVAAQGPPFLTILAGFLVLFLVIWIVRSVIVWFIGLIVNLASPK